MVTKHKLYTLFFLLLTLSSCSLSLSPQHNSDNTSAHQLLKEYQIIEEGHGPNIIFAKKKNQDEFVKINWIQTTSPENAKEIAKIKLEALLSQFRFTFLAFIGNKDKGRECQNKFSPKFILVAGMNMISSYVDNRFAMCICQINYPAYKRFTSAFMKKDGKSLMIIDYYFNKVTAIEDVSLYKDIFNLGYHPMPIDELVKL